MSTGLLANKECSLDKPTSNDIKLLSEQRFGYGLRLQPGNINLGIKPVATPHLFKARKHSLTKKSTFICPLRRIVKLFG